MSDRPSIRIGVYGPDIFKGPRHGCGLWPAGVFACVEQAEAVPIQLVEGGEQSWAEKLGDIHGVVLISHDSHPRRHINDAEALVTWCHNHNLPYLGVDHGLLLLNSAHGGTNHSDLPRDLPEALQHRHPPERGLRHAINVIDGTYLSELYGEGEVVVNSEHRKAICRLARGFRVSAQALDGVIEAVEATGDWWAMGVQWNPVSSTSSGLD
ncbi:MAG: gamma-glutamyl-gamma-aminobutyrate hydrolase family protein, partial [Gemmataceae bacterium]|nr:gamma-glutamyl-gamma-aminobutyrate hydrolase family protein [Gemmataceae bacterium]